MRAELVLSAIATFVACPAALVLLYWQVRSWPDDRQKWAALGFMLATAIITAQLCWTYLGGPSLGASWRGVASYCLWAGSLGVLAWETTTLNLDILKRKRRRR